MKERKYLLNAAGLFAAVVFFACLPVWYFQYYLTQDGTPHLYNSYILLELLRGNQQFADIYSINPYPIPNESGHWMLAFLLLIFSPQISSKIMVTLTFGGVVFACGWLRRQTAANGSSLVISLLLGAVFAFNWMWFLGFYNFILGVIGYAFTLGLFWKWRENLDYRKSIILALLIIFVFFSHLISFGMLAGAMFLISILSVTKRRTVNFLFTLAAFVPSIPLLAGYKLSTESGGAFSPKWNQLHNFFSLKDWILQLQTADPFQLLSRKAFPFTAAESFFFAVFSSAPWIFATLFLMAAGTWICHRRENSIIRENLSWFAIVGFSIFFWVFAPDDFGDSHGGFLRERILLCGLIGFIPIYKIEGIRRIKGICSVILILIIIFQTAVLWNYTFAADKIADNYLSAKPLVSDHDALASIIFTDLGCRYKANPVTNLNPLLGIDKQTRIWDNYEAGYYLFPVITDNLAERKFIFDFRQSNAFDTCQPEEITDKRIGELKNLLAANHQKISVLLVWNGDQRIIPMIGEWFEVEPFFDNDKVKLYRHKK